MREDNMPLGRDTFHPTSRGPLPLRLPVVLLAAPTPPMRRSGSPGHARGLASRESLKHIFERNDV